MALALSPDGRYLYVAETFGNAVFRIRIEDDGSAGAREEVAKIPGVLPDGLAFDTVGNLYVACYEPSQVLRVSTDGTVARFIGDEEAHLFCHPTNLAFREGTSLLRNSLGTRFHSRSGTKHIAFGAFEAQFAVAVSSTPTFSTGWYALYHEPRSLAHNGDRNGR